MNILCQKSKKYIEANQLLVEVYFYELSSSSLKKDHKLGIILANNLEYNEKIGYQKIEPKESLIESRII